MAKQALAAGPLTNKITCQQRALRVLVQQERLNIVQQQVQEYPLPEASSMAERVTFTSELLSDASFLTDEEDVLALMTRWDGPTPSHESPLQNVVMEQGRTSVIKEYRTKERQDAAAQKNLLQHHHLSDSTLTEVQRQSPFAPPTSSRKPHVISNVSIQHFRSPVSYGGAVTSSHHDALVPQKPVPFSRQENDDAQRKQRPAYTSHFSTAGELRDKSRKRPFAGAESGRGGGLSGFGREGGRGEDSAELQHSLLSSREERPLPEPAKANGEQSKFMFSTGIRQSGNTCGGPNWSQAQERSGPSTSWIQPPSRSCMLQQNEENLNWVGPPAPVSAPSRVMKKFVPPVKGSSETSGRGGASVGGKKGISSMVENAFRGSVQQPQAQRHGPSGDRGSEEKLPEELKGCDPLLIERIEQEIIDRGDPVTFDDIAGLAFAKQTILELICWPMSRPDIFTGLRALPRGLLLFGCVTQKGVRLLDAAPLRGSALPACPIFHADSFIFLFNSPATHASTHLRPPGTGKTLIAKAIAHQSGATFFNISASSLTSKWIGEGEKLVRTLFRLAAYMSPSIVFIDEVDSLLCQRSADENEASRRMKTEFLVQLDGCGSAAAAARVLLVGATNRPQELDEAARRRFVKRLYIPLPEAEARRALIVLLLRTNNHQLTPQEIEQVVTRSRGFSGSDVHQLCTEAAMGPIRDMTAGLAGDITALAVADVPPIHFRHFLEALSTLRPSVSEKDLDTLLAWNDDFGTFSRQKCNVGEG